MIHINMLHEAGSLLGASVRSDSLLSKRKNQTALAALLLVLICISGSIGYFMMVGVPESAAPYVPESLASALNFKMPAPPPVAVASKPAGSAPVVANVVANGSANPNVATPSNNAVEEVVQTMRPDMFYMKERKEYRQLLPSEKIVFQKAVLAAAFATFRAITPNTFGFTDLSFKIPDYYYARGLATDAAQEKAFLDSLKRRSIEFTNVPPPEGKKTLEFSAYGRLNVPEAAAGEKLALLNPDQVVQEVTELNALATKAQIHFSGLDNPQVTDHGLYRRIMYRAQTKSDFPTLQLFADAFRASKLRVGVLQVNMRPAADEGSVTVFDFVVYTTPK